jgi:inorganic pyrophosphatase
MPAIAELPPSSKDGRLHVIVESPAGATAKLKWDAEVGLFVLSRPLPLGLSYPHHWGFVPGTRAADGDPLDALVLADGTSFPGLLLPSRPLGVVRLEQNRKSGGGRERNDRVVAVAAAGARHTEVRSHEDLPTRVRQEIERFFLDAVFFEHKDATILGWGGPDDAWEVVRASVTRP